MTTMHRDVHERAQREEQNCPRGESAKQLFTKKQVASDSTLYNACSKSTVVHARNLEGHVRIWVWSTRAPIKRATMRTASRLTTDLEDVFATMRETLRGAQEPLYSQTD